MRLYVDLGKNSYPIYIENHLLDKAGDYIAEVFNGKKIMIISDDHVAPLYEAKLKASLSERYECFSLTLPHLSLIHI